MDNFIIVTDVSKQELFKYYGLIKLLNPGLNQNDFTDLTKELINNENYKLLAVYDNEICVALCGYWIATKYYSGKYLELDNVIVLPDCRNKGLGKLMFKAVEEIALKNNCKMLMLDAYLSNAQAHKFYEDCGMHKAGYHFLKKLS